MSRIKSPINDGDHQRPDTTTRNAMEIMQRLRRRSSSPQMPPPVAASTAHDRQSSISSLPGNDATGGFQFSSFDRNSLGPLTRSRSKGENPFSTSELIQNHLFQSTESETDRKISEMIKDSTFSSTGNFGGNSWQSQQPPFAVARPQQQTSLDWFKSSVDDPFKSTDSLPFKKELAPSHVDVDYNKTFLTMDQFNPSGKDSTDAPGLQPEPEEPQAITTALQSDQNIMQKVATAEAAPPKRGTLSYAAATPLKIPKPKRKATKSRSTSSSSKNFINGKPTEVDVLCGRGGRTNHHTGNIQYLRMKEEIQDRYLAASKEEKTAISQELVDAIHSRGGRFLKLDERSNQWYEIDDRTARKKASQTLREMNTPEYRAQKRQKYAK